MQYQFENAEVSDLDAILQLIRLRMDWMDRVGIRQWNVTRYLEAYPRSYYEEKTTLGQLYVLKKDSCVVGAVVLSESDVRWAEDASIPAFYIHNLVSKPSEKGAGTRLLTAAEALARDRRKQVLRLDCAVDNEKLNQYYEGLGFHPCGFCQAGLYRGIKRQKLLAEGNP